MRRWISLLAISAACASAPEAKREDRVPTPAASLRPEVPGPLSATPRTSKPDAVVALPNGLKLVIIERRGAPVVSVRLLFGEGSTSDPVEQAGATQLAFALLGERYEIDAAERPILSEKSLRTQLAEIGGRYVAAVGHDSAYVGVDGHSSDLAAYLAKLGEAVARPRCGVEGLAHYRRSMLESLEELEIADSEVIQLVLAQASFGAGHPYARPVMGTFSSLQDLSWAEVRAHQTKLLVPGRATLIIAGNVDAERGAGAARKAFARWAPTAATPGRSAPLPAATPAPRKVAHVIARSPSTTTLICATRPLGDLPIDDSSADVLAHVMGDGIGSRLAVLREQHGWTYSPYAQVVRRRSGRALFMCARVDAAETPAAVRVFVEAIDRARNEAPTQLELERAKAVLGARAVAARSGVPGAVANAIERLSYGSGAELRAASLQTLTIEQVRGAADRVLDARQLNITLVGSPAIARQAVQSSGLGPVHEVRLADLGDIQRAEPASPARAPKKVDPRDGKGSLFDIHQAARDSFDGTGRIVIRISDRTLSAALEDDYSTSDGSELIGDPELIQTVAVKGEPPIYYLLLRARLYSSDPIRVTRASGGTTPSQAVSQRPETPGR